MKKTKEQFPDHITGTTLEWCKSVLEHFVLEPHHVRLLILAAESWDQNVLARSVLEREGFTFLDRFDQPRPRPEVAIARDCKISFCRIVRELDLDGEVVPDSKRPPELARYRSGPHAA